MGPQISQYPRKTARILWQITGVDRHRFQGPRHKGPRRKRQGRTTAKNKWIKLRKMCNLCSLNTLPNPCAIFYVVNKPFSINQYQGEVIHILWAAFKAESSLVLLDYLGFRKVEQGLHKEPKVLQHHQPIASVFLEALMGFRVLDNCNLLLLGLHLRRLL